MKKKRDIFEEDFVTEPEPETAPAETSLVFGVVSDCERLNIRRVPTRNGEIVTIIAAGTKLMIDISTSTDDWYCVCTSSGIEGFCMKQYITIQE